MWPRKRYDPYPDLLRLQGRLQHELDVVSKEALTQRVATVETICIAQRRIRSAIHDSIIYATVGKDRKKLTPEFVDKTEGYCRPYIDTLRDLTSA